MDDIRNYVNDVLVPQLTNHLDEILPELHFYRKGNSYVSKYHTDGRKGSRNAIQSQIRDGSSVVIDYGSNAKNRNVISLYQEFNGIADRKEAVAQLCAICHIDNPFNTVADFSLIRKKEVQQKAHKIEYAFHDAESLKRLEQNGTNNFLLAFKELFWRTTYEIRANFILQEYRVGTAVYGTNEFVAFPYIDDKIREIKLMQYEPHTLHRCGITTNIHSQEKMYEFLGRLKPRLFGYHLALLNRDKEIALVESEKTALIMAVCEPTYIWLATGGCKRLNEQVAELLNCRTVRMFFDAEIDDVTRNEKIALLNRHCLSVIYKDDRKALLQYGEKSDIADLYIAKLRDLKNYCPF